MSRLYFFPQKFLWKNIMYFWKGLCVKILDDFTTQTFVAMPPFTGICLKSMLLSAKLNLFIWVLCWMFAEFFGICGNPLLTVLLKEDFFVAYLKLHPAVVNVNLQGCWLQVDSGCLSYRGKIVIKITCCGVCGGAPACSRKATQRELPQFLSAIVASNRHFCWVFF